MWVATAQDRGDPRTGLDPDARRAEQATFEAAALAPRLREAQAGQRAVFFWTPPTLSMVCS